ncbi:hypothetical protein AB0H83_37250 [Dactylosporangium sp. NPDC050688]|uniref:hypothetical protein n=1 Tax=Dactylosporangium sp. NPDC050688 TaxID=3157217 RepID=UPI0033C245CE
MTADPTADRVPDRQPVGVDPATAGSALTPLRAVVLPGLTETDEPAAPPPSRAARRLPWPRRSARPASPESKPARVAGPPSPAGLPPVEPVAPAGATTAAVTVPEPGDEPAGGPVGGPVGGLGNGLANGPVDGLGNGQGDGPVEGAAAERAAQPAPSGSDPLPPAQRPERRRRRSEPETAAPVAGRRSSRRMRVALGAAAAVVLVGPLAYAFGTGSGGVAPERAAAPPVVGIAQPWPEDTSPTATMTNGSSATPDLSAAGSSPPVPAGVSGSDPAAGAPAAAGAGGGSGAGSGSGSGAGQPTAQAGAQAPKPPAATTAAAKATSTRTAGVGCANNDSQNWYTNGMNGSWSEKSGGAAGCGRALAMPMSGNASYDTGPYVVWWFVTNPVVTGSCAVSVYIPSTGVANDVAGRPAYYKVLGGRNSSTVYARFTIDQTVNRGRWVSAGTHAVHNGEISVHLANRGGNPNGERIGAAQVRLSCTAA